jgi:hypothetical protein
MRVNTVRGHYLVTVTNSHGNKRYQVFKDKTCSCGKANCDHVQAVALHIKMGGSRAEDLLPQKSWHKCPICDSTTDGGRPVWLCSREPSHYFEWLNERHDDAVRKFLTQPQPGKMSSIIERREHALQSSVQ